MFFCKGMVVRSKKGHDKGRFYVVKEEGEKTLLLSDGMRIKNKNPLHLAPTKTVLDEEGLSSDGEIIRILSLFTDRNDLQEEVI